MSDFNEEYLTKEQTRREKRRGHIADIIAVIFCLIAAIGIWLVAFNNGKEPQKENETPKTEAATLAVLPVDYIVK